MSLFALVGCSQPSQTGSTENTPTNEKTSVEKTPTETTSETPTGKVYRVMMYPDYAPYQYLNEKGNIIGFDVDVINAIAKSQGLNIKVEQTPWKGMLERLNTGGDEKFTLSNAYLYGKDAIITKENITDINTFEDMKARTIGAQVDTIYASELIKLKGENAPTLIQAPTSFLAFTDLVKDKVEGVYAHENILRHYAKSQPQIKFRFSGEGTGFSTYEMVVVAKKGNTELINKVNNGISAIAKDGSYKQMYVKWFNREPQQVPN
ncbi:substrate-binding periplasmic protein [Faucicola mancuniensis]|uniref:substrate-binding periplasmic protein n=1 Tax=Faucicola mancuniensis TaxID=1309795 RepID=UPI00397766CD